MHNFSPLLEVGAKDADVGLGTVVGVCGLLLDGINHVKTGNNFPEDGVLTVKMRRTAHGLIDLAHFRTYLYAAIRVLIQTGLNPIQTFIVKHPAPNNIELHCGTTLLRIHIVALASGSQNSTAMEDAILKAELGGNGIGLISLAKQRPGLGILGIRISALNHKVAYDAVEKQGIVCAFCHKTLEVVSMLRRGVVKLKLYVSFGSLKYNVGFFLLAGSHDTCQNKKQYGGKNKLFHF